MGTSNFWDELFIYLKGFVKTESTKQNCHARDQITTKLF